MPFSTKKQREYLQEYLKAEVEPELDNPHTIIMPWVALPYIIEQLKEPDSPLYQAITDMTSHGYRFTVDADNFHNVDRQQEIHELDHRTPFHIWFQNIYGEYGRTLVIEPSVY